MRAASNWRASSACRSVPACCVRSQAALNARVNRSRVSGSKEAENCENVIARVPGVPNQNILMANGGRLHPETRISSRSQGSTIQTKNPGAGASSGVTANRPGALERIAKSPVGARTTPPGQVGGLGNTPALCAAQLALYVFDHDADLGNSLLQPCGRHAKALRPIPALIVFADVYALAIRRLQCWIICHARRMRCPRCAFHRRFDSVRENCGSGVARRQAARPRG